MSTARSLPCGRTWLRALVLLCALLVPGAHSQVHATPAVTAEIVEYDVLDAAVRPPSDVVRRSAVPLPLAPGGAPAPAAPRGGALPVPPRPPHPLPALRTVVLRC
ncbi:hypothetical protein [Streptomyces sp. NPDC057616]|uniref:hypothetical protein n=1 Tax=Streptomyces sp. NPDC057616 TaxID=3346183 RepID=UPI00368438D0